MDLIKRFSLLSVGCSILFSFAGSGTAGAQSECSSPFTDVASEPLDVCLAVSYLKEQGFVTGYEDGTFKPNNKVNRAEVAKFVFGPLMKEEESSALEEKEPVHKDIPADAWYHKYVLFGVDEGILDGPPAKPDFNPGNNVLKVELLKIMQLAHGIDPISSYSEIKLPLASDVTDPEAWYYPYIRYAITSSMIMINTDGTLKPAEELSRGQIAVLLHRLLMYKEGRRAQALLSEAENEILIILGVLEQNNIEQAEYASARSLLAARGALTSHPDTPIVKGALKFSEAFRTLVRGYREGITGGNLNLNTDKEKALEHFNNVVKLAGDAWHLAEKCKEFDASLTEHSDQVQKIAKKMADDARLLIKSIEESVSIDELKKTQE